MVGLIANELVTNALKHASPDNCAGSVTVIFKSLDGECILCVEDDGIGLPRDAEVRKGLGQKLIRSLVAQLQGSFEICPRTDGRGTIAKIRFPAPAAAH